MASTARAEMRATRTFSRVISSASIAGRGGAVFIDGVLTGLGDQVDCPGGANRSGWESRIRVRASSQSPADGKASAKARTDTPARA